MNRLCKNFVIIAGSAALLSATLLSTTAMSADSKTTSPPWLTINVPIEVQNDYDYHSDTAGGEVNNLTLKLEPEATIKVLPVPGLSFFIHGVFEQVADGDANEDRYFKDEGFYIQNLYVQYESGRFGFRGGKMNPGFGITWDQAPGIYGSDMAEDYEMAERIALSASLGFDPQGLGSHTLTAGTFFLDTSPLQNTIYSKTRGTLGRSDGGVSNTGDFSSFNLVLEGGKFPATPALTYHLAYIHQAHGSDGSEDETGLAAGLTSKFDLGKNVTLTPLFEAVFLNDQGGTKDKDRQYWTVSALTEWQKWNLALAYTKRRTETTGTATVNDYQGQASIGYAFKSGMTVDLGWKRLEESGAVTDRIGFLLTYALGFEY
jgi:hypothetical protein